MARSAACTREAQPPERSPAFRPVRQEFAFMMGKASQRFSMRSLAALWAVGVGLMPQPARSDSDQPISVPEAAPRVIVRFAKGTSEAQARSVRKAAGATQSSTLPLIAAEVWTVAGDPHAEAARISREPGVVYAEPDYLWRADRVPNDPEFPSQWALHNTGQTSGAPDADIDAPEAWDQATGRPILLGIIDTGIDTLHPDLAANLWTNPGEIPGNNTDDDGNGYVDDMHGWDFVEADNQPFDQNGHGTHVAGIAAAVGNNGLGVAGVHWSAQLVALRFLNADGVGSTSAAVLALQYAIRMHIPITNNSWGGGPYSQALRDAIAKASDSGMLFIAAAGNFGKNIDITPHYPASYDDPAIISVAATNHVDRLAQELLWRSNYGPRNVDLAAPGVEVISTWPGGTYQQLSGTSMATPHVAGAAALIWSEHPELTGQQVKTRLLASTDPLPDLTTTTVSGGRLNLAALLAEPDSTSPGIVTDLDAEQVEGTRVHLSFTSPGDDGETGTAEHYVVRFARSPLGSTPPDSVVEWIPVVLPQSPGAAVHLTVEGLSYGTTYYFQVLAEDDWFNRSTASNELMATTLGPPLFQLPDSLATLEVLAGADTVVPFTLLNQGAGELFFSTSVEYPHDRGLAAAAPIDTLDLLLLYADHGALALQSQLSAFADVGRVDLWNATSGPGDIPRFRDVRDYDVILAWNNRAWADPFEIGALLADCIDSGLAVVTLVDCWGTGPFSSFGRYFEDAGYSPFESQGEALFEVRTLGAYTAGHPIMKGVEDLAIASYHNQVRLSEGARPVAYWNDGTPLVATNPGSVAINVWPGDGYHWLGDFPRLVHNAVRYAAGLDSWLAAFPERGEVAPGDSLTLALHVDARRLVAGEFAGYLQIASSDPVRPQEERTVQLSVQGSARVSILSPELEIPDAFLGYEDTIYLALANLGTAPLRLTTPSFDVSHFRTSLDSLVIPPEATDSLPILFTPPAVGEIWCNLDLVTNDPRHLSLRVVLHAQTELPPHLSLSDTTTTAALYAGSEGLDTLHLTNSGEGTLAFHTGLRGSSSPTGVRTAYRSGGASADSVPVLVWARYADLSPNHEYETLKDALAEYGTPASLLVTTTPDPAELEHLLFDRQMLLVLEQENALPDLGSLGAAFAPVLEQFVTEGGTVLFLMEWGSGAGFAASTGLLDARPIARGSQIPLAKVVPAHPLLAGTSDSLVGGNLTVWYDLLTPSAEVIVSDTSGQYAVVVSRRHGAGQALLLGFDYFTYNDDMARILYNAVLLSRQNVAWLDVTPDSGYVEAGQSLDLVIRCDATSLDGGTYAGKVMLETNDPTSPRVSLPVALQVTDAPHLRELAPVDFGVVYAGVENERVLTLRNSGNRVLRIDTLGFGTNGFLWDPTGFEVPPRSERQLVMYFSSGLTGTFESWLRLRTNDPLRLVDSVQLMATVQIAPVLVMDSDTLQADLPQGGGTTVAWTIHNTGGSPLQIGVMPAYDGPDAAPGTAFVPLAPLPAPKSQAGVVALKNGGVLVFGGFGPLRNVTNTVYELAPGTNQWQTRAPLPAGSFGMAVALDSQGRVYSFGVSSDASYRYDPQENAWTRIADMPQGRVWGAAAVLGEDGLIYVTGGEGDGPDDPLAVLQIYHPEQDFWTVGPAMSEARYAHAAVACPGGRIYVMGGRTSFNNSPIATVEVYDLVTGKWSRCSDRPEAANHFAACMAPDQKIYTAGGKFTYEQGLGPFSAAVWIYDPGSDSWSAGPALPRAVGECGAAWSDGFVRILGGSDTTVVAEQWGLPAPPWLGWAGSQTSVDPGESLLVTLPVDARGLTPGTHRGRARLVTNDPGAPLLDKQVALNVSPAPRLWLLDTTLDFGPVFLTGRDSLAVNVANVGSTTLELYAVSSALSMFPPPESQSVPAGKSATLWFHFVPDFPGPALGQIELHSNDPDRPVAIVQLAGTGVQPGVLAADTTALTIVLPPAAETSCVVSVRNDGSGPLHWFVTGADVPLTNPGSPARRAPRTAPEPSAEGDLRRLTGVVVAFSDANFSPAFSLVQSDLEARGARVLEFARPLTAAGLDSIDVLILDDYVGSLFPEELALIRDWVFRGGRLLLQNSQKQGIPRASALMDGTGIAQYAQNRGPFVYSRFFGRAAEWDADSITTPATDLWCHAAEPAEVLVRDDFDRAAIATSRQGAGRVVVTSAKLLTSINLAKGDNRAFAVRLLDWLAVGTPLVAEPAEGELQAGGSVDVLLSTNAWPLTQGAYHERVVLHSEDGLGPGMDLRVSLVVSGEEAMSVAADSLWFDTTFVGYDSDVLLEIANLGTAPLVVLHAFAYPDVFQVADSTLVVPPLSTRPMRVSFAPLAEGTLAGVLKLHTTDPHSPEDSVVLVGSALRPPALSSQTSSIDLTVQAGDTAFATLSLINQGHSDLALTVMPLPDTVVSGPRRRLWTGPQGASPTGVPSPVDPSARHKGGPRPSAVLYEHHTDRAGFGIWDDGDIYRFQFPGAQDQLAFATTLLVFRAHQVDYIKWPYLFNGAGMIADSLVETRADSVGVEVRYYAHSDDQWLALERRYTFENGRSYLAMETRLTNIGVESIDDLVLKQEADWDLDNLAFNDHFDYDWLRRMPYGWDRHYAGIASLETPAVIDIQGNDDMGRRETVVDYEEGPVHNIDGHPMLHFELGDLAPGESATVHTVLAAGDSLSDLQREVDRGLQRVKWLDADARFAVVAPGSQFDLHLTFDASQLFAGDYRARLVVGSNDPALPKAQFPVHLKVLGQSVAAVDRDSADFGVVYLGYPATLELKVSNEGTDSLRFFDVSSDLAEVQPLWTRAQLPPRQDTMLRVTFVPRDSGLAHGRLVLVHDDTLRGPVELPVRAMVEWPPEINVEVDTVKATMGVGTVAYRSFLIQNVGRGRLEWSFAPHAQISAVPPFGVLPTGATALVTLRVSAAGLPPGAVFTAVELVHNDPAHGPVEIPFALDVFAVRRGDTYTDNQLDTRDIVFMVNSIWKGGPDPVGDSGDLDCDHAVTITDLILLVNYILKEGPPPDCDL